VQVLQQDQLHLRDRPRMMHLRMRGRHEHLTHRTGRVGALRRHHAVVVAAGRSVSASRNTTGRPNPSRTCRRVIRRSWGWCCGPRRRPARRGRYRPPTRERPWHSWYDRQGLPGQPTFRAAAGRSPARSDPRASLLFGDQFQIRTEIFHRRRRSQRIARPMALLQRSSG